LLVVRVKGEREAVSDSEGESEPAREGGV